MRLLRTEKGASRIAMLIWVVLLSVVIYVGYKLLPIYLDYWRMNDEMTTQASMAQVLKDDEILADLVKKAKELELPLGPENFVLNRDDEKHRMTIRTMWDVEIHFPYDVYVRNFHFEPVADVDTKIERK